MRPKRRPRSSRPRTGNAPLPPEEPRRVQAHVHREPGLSSLEIGGGAMGVESPGEVVEERAVQGLLEIAPVIEAPGQLDEAVDVAVEVGGEPVNPRYPAEVGQVDGPRRERGMRSIEACAWSGSNCVGDVVGKMKGSPSELSKTR